MVTYADIETEVRKITGRYNQSQMPSSTIQNYFNRYYTLHFPEEYKFLKLTSPYVITTIPNVDTYPFPYQANLGDPLVNNIPASTAGNITVQPPIYCQGYPLNYYQDRSNFFNLWPKRTNVIQIGTGDGTVGPYTGTIPFSPMLRAQYDVFGNVFEPGVLITAQQSNPNYTNFLVTDKPQTGSAQSDIGILVGSNIDGSKTNTVNYITGAFQFTTLNVLPDGIPIEVQAVPYQAARPIAVLFYNQVFTLRPVPSDIFQLEFQVSRQPAELLDSTKSPELDEWYMMLACGTADLIYTAFPDPEGQKYNSERFDWYRQQAQRRTLKQLSTQRTNTIFSAPGNTRWGIGWFGNSLPGVQ